MLNAAIDLICMPPDSLRPSTTFARLRYLDEQKPDLREVRETLTDIGDITQRAGDMIQGLRDMLKRDTLGLTSVDVNQLVRSVERIVHSDAVQHRVRVELDLSPSVVPIKGDGVQLQQVVLNLMVNAFHATSDPSLNGASRRVMVRSRSVDGSNVLVEVRDDGTGIPADKLESIFEPFVTSKRDGLGMGLSICRTIVERRGGKLSAANNPDRGATFSITLPAARDGT
jgi:two-component system, LuxR family, sensor kinase FixL